MLASPSPRYFRCSPACSAAPHSHRARLPLGQDCPGDIYRRSEGKGEDPRYEALTEGLSPSAAAIKVFGLQGASQWSISMPLQVSAAAGATEGNWWAVLAVGVVIWGVGLTFEAVGDAQLAAFKADPDHSDAVMDRGLWAWTIASPIAMTHLLRNVSGAILWEKTTKKRPEFPEYTQRTAYFVPARLDPARNEPDVRGACSCGCSHR